MPRLLSGAGGGLIITVTQNRFQMDLEAEASALGWVSTQPLTLIIESGVIVGSTSVSQTAITITAGDDVTVIVRGRIQGRGGAGGAAGDFPGGAGGQAIAAFVPNVKLVLNEGAGQIWGGGGGGAGRTINYDKGQENETADLAGGGGAGYNPGSANRPARPATTEVGGLGEGPTNKRYGGLGGGPGQNGQSFNPGAVGGGAGRAIVNLGNFIKIGTGDIRGPQL